MISKLREKTEVANERKISLDSLIEMLKTLNRLMLQSTINDYADNHSNKNVAKSNLKNDQQVDAQTSYGKKGKIIDTDTTKGNSTQKLLMNKEIPAIIQGIILQVSQTTTDVV